MSKRTLVSFHSVYSQHLVAWCLAQTLSYFHFFQFPDYYCIVIDFCEGIRQLQITEVAIISLGPQCLDLISSHQLESVCWASLLF